MTPEVEMSLYVLILAVPLGLQLVQRVSPLLHTPLMSLTNAISAISVVGAILVAGLVYAVSPRVRHAVNDRYNSAKDKVTRRGEATEGDGEEE